MAATKTRAGEESRGSANGWWDGEGCDAPENLCCGHQEGHVATDKKSGQ